MRALLFKTVHTLIVLICSGHGMTMWQGHTNVQTNKTQSLAMVFSGQLRKEKFANLTI